MVIHARRGQSQFQTPKATLRTGQPMNAGWEANWNTSNAAQSTAAGQRPLSLNAMSAMSAQSTSPFGATNNGALNNGLHGQPLTSTPFGLSSSTSGLNGQPSSGGSLAFGAPAAANSTNPFGGLNSSASMPSGFTSDPFGL